MAEDAPAVSAEHSVRWFTAEEITTVDGISEDSRILAAELLRHLTRGCASKSGGFRSWLARAIF
jgi:hypothetical protein